MYTRSLRIMQVLKLRSIGWRMGDEAADSLSIDKYVAEHQEVTATLDTWLQVCIFCEERKKCLVCCNLAYSPQRQL